MKPPSLTLRLSALGLFIAAAAWVFHQQTGYVLASYGCGKRVVLFWPVSAITILVVIAAAALSSAPFRRNKDADPPEGRPRQFMAWIGVTAAGIFGFAVLMQTLAGFVLPPLHALSSAIPLEWEFDPWVVGPLALSALLYGRGLFLLWERAGVGRGVKRWQAAAFALGWLTLAVALVSPLHEFGEHLFVAHMIEHELLMAVAAPLLALSKPIGMFLHALPRPSRLALVAMGGSRPVSRVWRWLVDPTVATVLHAIAIWVWHIPALLDATLDNETLHRLQHVSFLVTALFFWWSIVRLRPSHYGVGAFHVFATMIHTTLLGALLTLAPHVFYPRQTADAVLFGLTPLEDQQLAGLFMWIPGGAVYLLAGLVLAGAWLTSGIRPRAANPALNPVSAP